MNWGYKIMFVIIAFIAIMSGMVFLAFQQHNEMIDSNYYEAEVNYQYLINAANNLNEISSDSLLIKKDNSLSLVIPSALVVGFQEGEIEFLKSSDESKDKKIKFIQDVNGIYFIDKAVLSSGTYKARVQWTSKSKKYYREQNILLD